MTTKVQIECDGWTDGCETYLNIVYTEDIDGELRENGWHDSETIIDDHYCPVCWKVYQQEAKETEDNASNK